MRHEIGSQYLGKGRCRFRVWAPLVENVVLRIVFPSEQLVSMERTSDGYWQVELEGIAPETEYFYRLEKSKDRPDPASHWQPEGVHGASRVVHHERFQWRDSDWAGMPLEKMIMYELHVGTFTSAGTLDAVIGRLDDLQELGVNTLNLMPLGQFPGERNWGYDTAYPYAVQNSYGGPGGLKRLVDACHRREMAVILDVVYNHLGPEGNYLGDFGPYFTDTYKTPWGGAVNFDQAYADGVRNYFIQNARHWFGNYHIDALRLDAIHAIVDMSALPFLRELSREVDIFAKQQGRKCLLIAESDLNDVRILKSREEEGMGLDAQWCDDFHHALHALLTGEKAGYYQDFGEVSPLIKALKEGYVITWQYSAYRKRHHGSSSRDRPARKFVVFSQNHDQVGNRMRGERVTSLISFEALKLAAGTVICSPYVPLIFMGEEYGEDAPFLYFIDHSNPDLIEAVRKGRSEEFATFQWREAPPDPQRRETFMRSKLNWDKRKEGKHHTLKEFYRCLLGLRKTVPALKYLKKELLEIIEVPQDNIIIFQRRWKESRILVILNFETQERAVRLAFPEGRWKKIVDSSERMWEGPGSLLPGSLAGEWSLTLSPSSFSIYQREKSA